MRTSGWYYAGRKKDSVRRRGINISAWEVERVVTSTPHPGMRADWRAR